MEWLEEAWAALAENQVASGGVVVVAASSLAWLLRRIPNLLWGWLLRRLLFCVEVDNNDEAFSWTAAMLGRKLERTSRVTALVNWDSLGHSEPSHRADPKPPSALKFVPAPSWHFFWLGRVPVVCQRQRTEQQVVAQTNLKRQETFLLYAPVWCRGRVKALLQEAKRAAEPEDAVSVYYNDWGEWKKLRDVRSRRLSSVVLRGGVAEDVLADARWFLESRKWYAEKGIPYRRSWLLHGSNGNGKSSLVHAVASELGLNIFRLNIADQNLEDSQLSRLMYTVLPGSIVLLEDVDAVFHGREKTQEKGITFSGLLNCLCGVAASDGRLVFMTTNHKDRLDPALVRRGRADNHVEVGCPDGEQAARMYLRFFPERRDLATALQADWKEGRTNMADLQEHFLTCRDDPERAASVDEIERSSVGG